MPELDIHVQAFSRYVRLGRAGQDGGDVVVAPGRQGALLECFRGGQEISWRSLQLGANDLCESVGLEDFVPEAVGAQQQNALTRNGDGFGVRNFRALRGAGAEVALDLVRVLDLQRFGFGHAGLHQASQQRVVGGEFLRLAAVQGEPISSGVAAGVGRDPVRLHHCQDDGGSRRTMGPRVFLAQRDNCGVSRRHRVLHQPQRIELSSRLRCRRHHVVQRHCGADVRRLVATHRSRHAVGHGEQVHRLTCDAHCRELERVLIGRVVGVQADIAHTGHRARILLDMWGRQRCLGGREFGEALRCCRGGNRRNDRPIRIQLRPDLGDSVVRCSIAADGFGRQAGPSIEVGVDLSIGGVVRVQQRGQPLFRRVEVMDQQGEAFTGDRRIGLPHRGHQFVEVAEHVVQLPVARHIRVRHRCARIYHGGVVLGRDPFAHQPEQVQVNSGQQAQKPPAGRGDRGCFAQRGRELSDPLVGRSIAFYGFRSQPLLLGLVRVHPPAGDVVRIHQRRHPFRCGVEVMDQQAESFRCDSRGLLSHGP
ncbi:hypothetical protein ACW9HJ_07960 [Nocardia gipuzkoensis]